MLKLEVYCIGDHAVLQHGQDVIISGKACPRHNIRIKIDNVTATALSLCDGTFCVKLPPMPSGGPFNVTITDTDSRQCLIYEDIYIGNVYLIAGQSNAALTLKDASDLKQEYTDKLIRQFEVRKQVSLNVSPPDKEELWLTAAGDTLGAFSAVGFHFARKLRMHLPEIAIGLINASYGGTNIQAWISQESLLECNTTAVQVRNYHLETASQIPNASNFTPDRNKLEQKMLNEFFPEPFPDIGMKKCWHQNTYNCDFWPEIELPDSWSLAGYDCPGIFWFRLKVDLPECWSGQALELHLGAIEQHDITYWNGVETGRTGEKIEITHSNEYRCYYIAPELVTSGVNQIAVRVSSFFPVNSSGGFRGPAEKMYLCRSGHPDNKLLLIGKWKFRHEKLFPNDGPEHFRHIGAGEPHSYHIMFDNMIYPLQNKKFASVIFYQGEANTVAGSDSYAILLELLIKDWRSFFKQTDLAFLIIQLPGFNTPRLYSKYSNWAKIRDAQLKVSLTMGIPPVVIAETGLAYDLHPLDKRLVGEIAAMAELARQNMPGIPISGPVCRKMEKLSNGIVRLYFELYGSKLKIKGNMVKHLVIAGDNLVFHEAESRIESDNTLLVWAKSVINPEAVCYAWCDNPAFANLYNQHGQPASPFRIHMKS
jgi:sialate O-acetylesterase